MKSLSTCSSKSRSKGADNSLLSSAFIWLFEKIKPRVEEKGLSPRQRWPVSQTARKALQRSAYIYHFFFLAFFFLGTRCHLSHIIARARGKEFRYRCFHVPLATLTVTTSHSGESAQVGICCSCVHEFVVWSRPTSSFRMGCTRSLDNLSERVQVSSCL